MKILITGALGHIGSKFIRSIEPGRFEEVVLLDNFMTQRYSSLFDLPGGVKFRFVEADICSADLDPIFADIGAVVHLAAVTDAASTFDKKDLVERINVEGTRKVAMACLNNGCRLLFPSTTSVYGTQTEVVDEDCPGKDLKPQSPYAESKVMAENLLKDMGSSGGLKFIVCRFGTIFGTSIGMRFHTAVNKFAWQACMGQPLTVWKTAMHQKRPYLDLGDAVMAMAFIIEKDLFMNEVFNIVTINASVGDVVGVIREFVPELRVTCVDSPIMNQLSYEVLSEKIAKKGFKFRGKLKNAVADTVRLLKNANQENKCIPGNSSKK